MVSTVYTQAHKAVRRIQTTPNATQYGKQSVAIMRKSSLETLAL